MIRARAGSLWLVTGALIAAGACSRNNASAPAATGAARADAASSAAHDAGRAVDAAADVSTRPTGPLGSIEGTVFLDGPIRRGPAITATGTWATRPACRDAALRYAWPFDTTTPGVFSGALVAAEARTDAPPPHMDRVMTFRDCDVVPRVLFAREGDRIMFHADTHENHLPHVTGSGASIDQVLISGQADQERRLPGPGRFPVTVRDLPEWVGAILLVLPNRFIDTTDAQGHFRIADVPVGNVLVHAWYPGTEEARNVVAVTEGQVAHVEFHLHQAPEPARAAAHDAGNIPVPP